MHTDVVEEHNRSIFLQKVCILLTSFFKRSRKLKLFSVLGIHKIYIRKSDGKCHLFDKIISWICMVQNLLKHACEKRCFRCYAVVTQNMILKICSNLKKESIIYSYD